MLVASAGRRAPADPGARVVPARAIPLPTTVSPDLQCVIAEAIPAAHKLLKGAAQWRALQRAEDEAAARGARALARQLRVTVTKATIEGVNAFLVRPSKVAPENRNRLLVHLHGGAYVLNAGEAGTCEAIAVAHASKTSVLSVDYRMPPDHPFPAALDDAVAVWRAVLRDHDPGRTALFGTSAGGGLTMATLLRLRKLRLPFPGALFVGTPEADLTKTGDTHFTNAGVDNMLGGYERLRASAKLYAGGRPLTDPLLSPVYGNLTGFPPTILISGTRDLFLSDTVRVHRKLRQAGVEAELHVFEGQSHAQYLSSYPSPEWKEAMTEIARFFDRHLQH